MSSTTWYIVSLLVTVVITNYFPDIYASKIYALDVPLVVRNGTGPVDLSCIYNVREDENGLVVKWYHNGDQIYQWIPPMPPQDVGIINDIAEYPVQNLKHSNSRSIIHLKMATVEMSGEYICTISTFQEEDSRKTKMIVYVPETSAFIHVSSFNQSYLNVTCVANGTQPRPILKIYIEGNEVDHYYDKIPKPSYKSSHSAKRTGIIRDSLEPVLVECEISIPRTDYKRREKLVYYPSSAQMLWQTSRAPRCQFGVISGIVFYMLSTLSFNYMKWSVCQRVLK